MGSLNNLQLGLLGYPQNVSGQPAAGNYMYRHASKNHWLEKGQLRYTIDSSGGQSGGPIYRNVNSDYYIIAVHAYGEGSQNSGRYLTKTVKDFINNCN